MLRTSNFPLDQIIRHCLKFDSNLAGRLEEEKEVESKYQEVVDDTGKSVYKCLDCGKQVNLKNNMRQHVRNLHAKPTNNVCQYCRKEFKNNLSCQRHIKNNRCPILSSIASQITAYPDLPLQ